MIPHLRRLPALLATVALLAACADVAAPPEAGPAAAPRLARSEAAPATGAAWSSAEPSPYVCGTVFTRPDGSLRYGRLYLHYADGVARAGGTLRFHYYLRTTTGRLAGTAACSIPASRAAVVQTGRFFRLSPEQLREWPRPEGVVIQCGTENDPCKIEGVSGTATPVKPSTGCDPALHFGCGESQEEGTGGAWEESAWGEETGGTSTGDGDCPGDDPACLKPLTTADKQAILNALSQHRRPDSEFTDPAAKTQCAEMHNTFNFLLSTGNVYRGGSDSWDEDMHFGETYGGKVHVDPLWLDAAASGDPTALAELAVTAYHEAAHVLGYMHGSPSWINNQDYYSEPYFNRLNPGPNSCVKR